MARAPRLPQGKGVSVSRPTVPDGFDEMPSVDTVGLLAPAHDVGACACACVRGGWQINDAL